MNLSLWGEIWVILTRVSPIRKKEGRKKIFMTNKIDRSEQVVASGKSSKEEATDIIPEIEMKPLAKELGDIANRLVKTSEDGSEEMWIASCLYAICYAHEMGKDEIMTLGSLVEIYMHLRSPEAIRSGEAFNLSSLIK